MIRFFLLVKQINWKFKQTAEEALSLVEAAGFKLEQPQKSSKRL